MPTTSPSARRLEDRLVLLGFCTCVGLPIAAMAVAQTGLDAVALGLTWAALVMALFLQSVLRVRRNLARVTAWGARAGWVLGLLGAGVVVQGFDAEKSLIAVVGLAVSPLADKIGAPLTNLIIGRRVKAMPGHRLRAIAAFFYSARTQERVFDPMFADFEHEYLEALANGRKWKANLLRFQLLGSFCSVVGFHAGFKTAVALWRAVASTVRAP